MRNSLFLTLMLVAVSVCGCSSLWADAVARRMTADFLAIDSYRGTVVERGLVVGEPDRVVKRAISYQRPFRYRAETIEPVERSGDLVVSDGSTVVVYWAREHFAIRVRGLTVPSELELHEHLRRQAEKNFDSYAYDRQAEESSADQPVTRWRVVPTRLRPYHYLHVVWMHSSYSIPMRAEYFDKRQELWYGMRLEDVHFGVELPASAFLPEFPPGTMIVELNMEGDGISLDTARANAGFDLFAPDGSQSELPLTKVVAVRQPVPMVALQMAHGGTSLFLIQNGYFGGEVRGMLGKEVAIGDATAHLSFAGPFATLTWVKGGTQLTLMGNVPFYQLIEIAETIRRDGWRDD